jgi:hypothetical protein
MSTSFLTRLRTCRSFLLVPGSQPETFMLNRLGGDAVIVELESAAALEDNKQADENAVIDLAATECESCPHRAHQ